MPINFFYIDVDIKLKRKVIIKNWISNIIKNYNYKIGNLNIIFVNDSYLLKLNLKYLNKNTLTDIITFDYNNNDYIEGDLYISIERVKDNSEIYSTDFSNEILRVIIHGIFHLLGFNDQTQDQIEIMRFKENEALTQVAGLSII